jgi:hypothetical protein
MGPLKVVWEVLPAFNALALVIVLFEKEIPVREAGIRGAA